VKAGQRLGPVETAIIVDAAATPEFGYLVGQALVKAIRDKILDPWAAFQQKHNVTVTGELAVAFAPTTALGLTANFGYEHQSLKVNGTTIGDQGAALIAAAADFDFGKISSVPIGLNLAYRLTAPLGSSELQQVNDLSGGIFYTARKELGLGLEIGWRSFKLP